MVEKNYSIVAQKKFCESQAKNRYLGVRKIAQELRQSKRQKVDPTTVFRYLSRIRLKPFKLVKVPLISPLNIEHRADFVDVHVHRDFSEEDCLYLAPSDEFCLYSFRKPNKQNDQVWASSRDDVWDWSFRKFLQSVLSSFVKFATVFVDLRS
jgi:hypothetical protein